MLGKRSSSMRRTVSMATLNQGSAPLDHPSQQDRPREKQKQKSVPHTHGFSSDSRNQSAGHGCRGDGPTSEHAGRAVKGVGLGIVAAMHNPEVCSVQMVLKEVCQSPNFGEPLLSTSVIRKAVQQPSQQSAAKFRHQGKAIVEESIVKKEVLTSGTSDAIPPLLFEVHFLETCFYCKRTIRQGRDIYMYRGDKAFCSVDCRHRQILADEHKEKCMLATFKTRSSGTNTKITAAAG